MTEINIDDVIKEVKKLRICDIATIEFCLRFQNALDALAFLQKFKLFLKKEGIKGKVFK